MKYGICSCHQSRTRAHTVTAQETRFTAFDTRSCFILINHQKPYGTCSQDSCGDTFTVFSTQTRHSSSTQHMRTRCSATTTWLKSGFGWTPTATGTVRFFSRHARYARHAPRNSHRIVPRENNRRPDIRVSYYHTSLRTTTGVSEGGVYGTM